MVSIKFDRPPKGRPARHLWPEKGGGGGGIDTKIPGQGETQNYYIGRDGQAIAESVLKDNNVYTNIFSTPAEKMQRTYFEGLFSKIGPQLMQTPEDRAKQIDEYGNTLYAQLKQPLDDERQKALLRTKENFNARGMLDSTAMEDYRKKNIEDVYSKGLVDAKNQAIFGREDLDAQNEARLMRLLAMASGGLQGDLSNLLNFNNASMNGYVGANQIANQRYAQALQAAGLRMQKDMFNAQLAGAGGGKGAGIGSAIGGIAGGIGGAFMGNPMLGAQIGSSLGGAIGGAF